MLYGLRILFKYRLYTIISVIGLGIAISSFWFIANYVKSVYQYDGFHQNPNRIYRLTMEITSGGGTDHYATTGKPLGNLLSKNYPGIRSYAKMTPLANSVVRINKEHFNEANFFNVNPEVLDVFRFDFIEGDSNTCFATPNSILLSRVIAEKYFNSIDIINKPIVIDGNQYTIRGVYKDWPENSHLAVDAILYLKPITSGYEAQDWFDLEQYNYVLLDPSNDQKDLNNKLASLTTRYVRPILEGSGMEVKFHSEPLNDLYFSPGLIDDVSKGNLTYINTLAFAGLLVLLIAGSNYINLSLTQSSQRIREIRLKKILGISGGQLFMQRTIESCIMTMVVIIISIVLIFVFSESYFDHTGLKTTEITDNWILLLIIPSLTFVFGLLGSSYSAVSFSFSSPLINKNIDFTNKFKKLLLGFQFVMASVILIATLTMWEQINFIKNKNLGFSKEEVLIIDLPDNEELKGRRIEFREQVKRLAGTKNASLIGGGALPGEENGKELFQVTLDGNKEERVYNIYRIDETYCELLDIKFALGRNFEAKRLRDKNDAVIINESLAKSLNWENPLGKIIWYDDQPREVIGVIKNFHNKSLHNVIEPIVFLFNEDFSTKLLIKTQISDIQIIKTVWTNFFPDIPFKQTYFDQFIDTMYTKEDHLVKLLSFFSIVSLTLSCMGLFAIFSLHVLHKTKDLSIKKVIGANSIDLLKSLVKGYASVTFLAISMAFPVAWLLMNKWLDEFSYKIQINPIVFILSASIILLVSFIALAYHIIRVVNINPVDSLKVE